MNYQFCLILRIWLIMHIDIRNALKFRDIIALMLFYKIGMVKD